MESADFFSFMCLEEAEKINGIRLAICKLANMLCFDYLLSLLLMTVYPPSHRHFDMFLHIKSQGLTNTGVLGPKAKSRSFKRGRAADGESENTQKAESFTVNTLPGPDLLSWPLH